MAGRRAAWVAGIVIAMGACAPDDAANHGGGIGNGADAGAGAGPDGGPSGPPMPTIPIFDDTHLHDVALVMAPADWQVILNDPLNEEWRHAMLIYDGVTVGDVGVRASGESSRLVGNAKMSMKISLDAFGGTKFGGVDTIKLKGFFGDRSMLRERLAMTVYRAVMPTPQMAQARLVVNGEVRGLYGVIEVWDAQSLKQHYTEPLGSLYRLRGVRGTDPYAFIGSNPGSYVPFPWEQHLSHPGNGDEVVPAFLQGLASGAGSLEQVADVDQLLAYIAAGAVVMNTDGLAGDTGVEDHYQYYDPATGKFFVLPWDPDNTFGANSETPDRYLYARFSKSRILTIVRDTPTFNTRYRNRLKSLMSMVTADTLYAEIDRMMDQVADIAHEDPFKGVDNHEWDNYRIHLKDFIAARYAYLFSQLGGGP